MRGWPALNCWPVACDRDLAMGLGFDSHVSKIGCVDIPGTDSHYPYAFHVFIPTGASSRTMFHLWTFPPTCHWATALNLTRAAKRLFPSAGSPFPCGPPVSQHPRVFCLGTTADIRTDPFPCITYMDRSTDCRILQVVIRTCGNRCFKSASFFTLAHGCLK